MVQADLEKAGLVFNVAETQSFRDGLKDGGFYKYWHDKLGDGMKRFHTKGTEDFLGGPRRACASRDIGCSVALRDSPRWPPCETLLTC